MNFGLPMGRVGRWALGVPGWVLIVLPIIACGLIWATVRWPVEGWRFSFVDVGYYSRVWEWRARGNLSGIDGCYSAGVVVFWLAAAWWILRVGMRGMAIRKYRPPLFQRGAFWRRGFLALLILMMAGVGMGVGWPYRLGQRWAREFAIPTAGAPTFAQNGVRIDHERIEAMSRAATRFGSAREKTAGLRLMVEHRDDKTVGNLVSAIGRERDPLVRALEIRILGVLGSADGNRISLELLSDPELLLREAAADAIGVRAELQQTQFSTARNGRSPLTIDCDPPIDVAWSFEPKVDLDLLSGSRGALEKMMLSGATPGEREAAARAMRGFPPAGYRLRYAEWGVFLADSAGKVQFVQAQLDEIPQFVHRIGNTTKEMEGRISPNFMVVLKPVIHLTANVPLAVDMEVSIRDGRPWVAYPKIDDLMMIYGNQNGMPGAAGNAAMASLDLTGYGSLGDLREGFPWILPAHRKYPWGEFGRGGMVAAGTIGGIGVRWQSLIVSPKKLDWMKTVKVGGDARFAWWKKLREVDCSWISSRGESERFLYYDGPSNRKSPATAGIANQRLLLTGNGRPGLYIEVTSAGVAMRELDVSDPRHAIVIDGLAQPTLNAEKELLRMLVGRGLTESEAGGVVDCWKPAFFQVPGRRFLTFMTAGDYDEACPLTIRPAPTERVRVGIIWTELGK